MLIIEKKVTHLEKHKKWLNDFQKFQRLIRCPGGGGEETPVKGLHDAGDNGEDDNNGYNNNDNGKSDDKDNENNNSYNCNKKCKCCARTRTTATLILCHDCDNIDGIKIKLLLQ